MNVGADVKTTDLEKLLASAPSDVEHLDGPSLRSMKAEYQEAESGISFLRRIVQGRLDLVTAELEKRAELDRPVAVRTDGDNVDVTVQTEEEDGTVVVSKIAEALGQHGRGPGFPRPPLDIQPPSFATEMLEDIDARCPIGVGHVTDAETSALTSLSECLSEMERKLTYDRHTLHRYIDVLQAEMIARYRSGALSVDALLAAE